MAKQPTTRLPRPSEMKSTEKPTISALKPSSASPNGSPLVGNAAASTLSWMPFQHPASTPILIQRVQVSPHQAVPRRRPTPAQLPKPPKPPRSGSFASIPRPASNSYTSHTAGTRPANTLSSIRSVGPWIQAKTADPTYALDVNSRRRSISPLRGLMHLNTPSRPHPTATLLFNSINAPRGSTTISRSGWLRSPSVRPAFAPPSRATDHASFQQPTCSGGRPLKSSPTSASFPPFANFQKPSVAYCQLHRPLLWWRRLARSPHSINAQLKPPG